MGRSQGSGKSDYGTGGRGDIDRGSSKGESKGNGRSTGTTNSDYGSGNSSTPRGGKGSERSFGKGDTDHSV